VAVDHQALRAALAQDEPVFVRWTPEVADQHGALREAIDQFDAGRRLSAIERVGWLRTEALGEPRESVTTLMVSGRGLLGFNALAHGQAELSSKHGKLLGARRPTQPATLLTQIARATSADAGTGEALVAHATAIAREAAKHTAATILALDPYDEATADFWRRKYGFRSSRTPAPGTPAIKRLWRPLFSG